MDRMAMKTEVPEPPRLLTRRNPDRYDACHACLGPGVAFRMMEEQHGDRRPPGHGTSRRTVHEQALV